jgi:hypothetical protein
VRIGAFGPTNGPTEEAIANEVGPQLAKQFVVVCHATLIVGSVAGIAYTNKTR